MEASARKRQQLLSEGSHESDFASDPSPIHRKDRRLSSSSSRKAQMLPRPHRMSMCAGQCLIKENLFFAILVFTRVKVILEHQFPPISIDPKV